MAHVQSANGTHSTHSLDADSYDDDDALDSSTESDTAHHLKSAIERRREVQAKQEIAINAWRKKLIFTALMLIITSAVLLFSEIWYANVVGICGAILGIYGAFKKNTEFVMVYMVLLALECVKNIGILIYYMNDINEESVSKTRYYLLLSACFTEEIAIIPFSVYYTLQLYRSLNLVNDDHLFE